MWCEQEDKMTVKEKKQKAQNLILQQMSIIGYGESSEEFVSQIGIQFQADKILKQQMDRVAKMFGYDEAWFS